MLNDTDVFKRKIQHLEKGLLDLLYHATAFRHLLYLTLITIDESFLAENIFGNFFTPCR